MKLGVRVGFPPLGGIGDFRLGLNYCWCICAYNLSDISSWCLLNVGCI